MCPRLRVSALAAVALGVVLAALPVAPAAAQWSLRLGAGGAGTGNTVLADTSCDSTAPPALFGCGTGSDGRRFSARGDFGHSWAGEIAVGARLRPSLRLEVAAIALPSLTLEANANFVRVGGAQPVRAKLASTALFAVLYWEPAATFGWRLGRWSPFVGAGVGAVRHRLDPVTFRFPGISPAAVTVTRGGRETDGAWLLTAGVGVAVRRGVVVDLAYRRLDLGGAQTDSGLATIVRPSRTFQLAVAATRARVRADEVVAGVRLGW